MTYRYLDVVQGEHLLTVTVNRPEAMNALHPPACRELDEVFDRFQDDPDLWVAILTGAGSKAFSAGNDLKWQAQHGAEALRREMDALRGGFGGITRRTDCFKPLIAAVNGLALGGGFELGLACDVIVAAETAQFGLPEPRVGAMAAAGGGRASSAPDSLPHGHGPSPHGAAPFGPGSPGRGARERGDRTGKAAGRGPSVGARDAGLFARGAAGHQGGGRPGPGSAS